MKSHFEEAGEESTTERAPGKLGRGWPVLQFRVIEAMGELGDWKGGDSLIKPWSIPMT